MSTATFSLRLVKMVEKGDAGRELWEHGCGYADEEHCGMPLSPRAFCLCFYSDMLSLHKKEERRERDELYRKTS